MYRLRNYFIGQNLVEQKWLNLGEVTKIMSNQKLFD